MPDLSATAPGCRLVLPSGATVFVTEPNAPCRHPAEAIARAFDRPRLSAAFGRAAIGRRGLVGIVEREGIVNVGDAIRLIHSPAYAKTPIATPDRGPPMRAGGT